MAVPAGRKWYSTAMALALGAIAAQFFATYHAAQGMMAMARASARLGERLPLRTLAGWQVHRSGWWEMASFALAAAFVGSWVLTHRDPRPGSRGVLLLLLSVHILLVMLII
jgi:hypothetical protein